VTVANVDIRRFPVGFSLLAALFLQVHSPSASAEVPTSNGPELSTQIAKSEWENLVAEAKKEGTVVVYTVPIGDAREVSIKAFMEKYGISIDYVTGRGPELAQKISTERGAGLYAVDAMFTGLNSFFNVIGPMKITVPLEPLLVLPEVTDGTKWRTGNVPFADKRKSVVAFSLARNPYAVINTAVVQQGEIISTEDMLAQKWKGKIVMNDPSTPGNGSEWFQFIMLQAYGREKGREYMLKLLEQEPVLTRDQRLQVEWVARAKYPIALGAHPSEVDKFVRLGAPIKFTAMKEGMPLTSGPLNLTVFERSPHPNATKLFVNWILSREGSSVMSKHAHYMSARSDVSAVEFDPIFLPSPTDILPGEDYKLADSELMKEAAEIFRDLIK
jgi:iron(III) transport system substrate-binding protein